jgi:nucleoside-diphosphate-sugar epimerase
MRVFITGNRGFVGKVVEKELLSFGYHVKGYYLIDDRNVLDYGKLEKEMSGYEIVIHLAAIESENAIETMDVNLMGTWNVLQASKKNDVRKIIYISSVDALGVFQGEGIPKYLPLDDDYPCHPRAAYSISKRLAEEMCRHHFHATGTSIIIFRPPGVWNTETYSEIDKLRHIRPEYEWDPYWEYGAFIDVRDLSNAIVLSLDSTVTGFHKHLIASDDITSSGMSSMELVHKLLPQVEWRGDEEYLHIPFKSLLDTRGIKELLGWNPKYSWKLHEKSAESH